MTRAQFSCYSSRFLYESILSYATGTKQYLFLNTYTHTLHAFQTYTCHVRCHMPHAPPDAFFSKTRIVHAFISICAAVVQSRS